MFARRHVTINPLITAIIPAGNIDPVARNFFPNMKVRPLASTVDSTVKGREDLPPFQVLKLRKPIPISRTPHPPPIMRLFILPAMTAPRMPKISMRNPYGIVKQKSCILNKMKRSSSEVWAAGAAPESAVEKVFVAICWGRWAVKPA